MQMQNQFLAQQQQRQQYIQHQQNQQAHEARAEQARAAQQDRLERERQHQQTMVQQQQLTTLKLQRQELMRQQEDLTRQQEEIDAHALESLRTSRAVFVSPAALSLGDVVRSRAGCVRRDAPSTAADGLERCRLLGPGRAGEQWVQTGLLGRRRRRGQRR
jgi:hypothetical protein